MTGTGGATRSTREPSPLPGRGHAQEPSVPPDLRQAAKPARRPSVRSYEPADWPYPREEDCEQEWADAEQVRDSYIGATGELYYDASKEWDGTGPAPVGMPGSSFYRLARMRMWLFVAHLLPAGIAFGTAEGLYLARSSAGQSAELITPRPVVRDHPRQPMKETGRQIGKQAAREEGAE